MTDSEARDSLRLLPQAPHLENPYPFYAALRDRAAWLAPYRGGDALVAARAGAVELVLTSPDIGRGPIADALVAPVGRTLLNGFYERLVGWREDERAQAIRRRLVFPLREASGVRGRQRASTAASRLAEEGLGEIDATRLEAFCEGLPIVALAHIMGAPMSAALGLGGSIQRLSAPLSAAAEPPSIAVLEAEYRHVSAVLSEHIGFLDDDFGGAAPAIGVDDLIANLIALHLQAQEATAALLLSCMLHHIEGRSQGADLREPAMRRAFIEEVERFDPPVQLATRVGRRKTSVAGRAVRPGQQIILLIGAANRDPAANVEPDRFDLYRSSRRSFGFSGGRHACPGRRLAMTIADVGFETLLQRWASIERCVIPAGHRPSSTVRRPMFRSL